MDYLIIIEKSDEDCWMILWVKHGELANVFFHVWSLDLLLSQDYNISSLQLLTAYSTDSAGFML